MLTNICSKTCLRNSTIVISQNICIIQRHIDKANKQVNIPFTGFTWAFGEANLHVNFIHSPHVFGIVNHTGRLVYKLSCCMVSIFSVSYIWLMHSRKNACIPSTSFGLPLHSQKCIILVSFYLSFIYFPKA